MSSSASNSATLPLLLEIGCEEIPARFLPQAQKDLGERLHAALQEARLLPQNPEGVTEQTFSTPRRLVAHVPAILQRQPDKTEEVTGPPVKVAFDAAGKPTRAAESFAHKNAADVKDLIRVTTPKGEYLALKKTTAGRAALEVLGEILPGVITGISFPKSMYWERSKTRFVRPIRWIVALLGEGDSARVVPFEVAGESSGALTYGHRLAGSAGIEVNGFRDYSEKLRTAYVEFDPENRRQTVRTELNMLLENSLEVVPDDDLVEWIVNSTEWLSGIRGDFDKRFLHLPREILITVMRDHQKYFAVQDGKGKLQPHFVAVLGRDRDRTGAIRAGHERVLTARFSDAEFFWKADQKIPLRDRLPMLDRVTYHAKLGSYGDKVRRMEAIAKEICGTLRQQGKMTDEGAALALRAIRLCKCDLTTQILQEFTELQGIVGGLYAREQGEPAEVAEAIYDHYLPKVPEDECPRSLAGALVSLADKLDAVVKGLEVGLGPTGSSDPFGLRRAGNGIVRLIAQYELRVDLRNLAEFTHSLSGQHPSSVAMAVIRSFFNERIRHFMELVEGLPHSIADAALGAGARNQGLQRIITKGPQHSPIDVVDLVARARGLQEMLGSKDLQAVCVAAKRIWNILAKSAGAVGPGPGSLDQSLLTEGPERDLYKRYLDVDARVKRLQGAGDYRSSLQVIATLRPAVDSFFDKVLVMEDNPGLRANRVFLLEMLDTLFSGVADLSRIELLEAGIV